jgi:hypothetical protein
MLCFFTLFLFIEHQFFVCMSLFCSSTRNKSFPLSALPWNLNWTWIILTPSSHWSQSNWPRTIRKWHGRTKPALSSIGSFRSIYFCFVLFCLYLEYRKEMSLALMMLLRGTKNILNNTVGICERTCWELCHPWKGARYRYTTMFSSLCRIEQTCEMKSSCILFLAGSF